MDNVYRGCSFHRSEDDFLTWHAGYKNNNKRAGYVTAVSHKAYLSLDPTFCGTCVKSQISLLHSFIDVAFSGELRV